MRATVDDPDDPRIAEFVGLRDRELAGPRVRRRRVPDDGVFVAEGDIVVERALRAGYRLRAALVDATRTDPLPPGIDDGATPVYGASPAVLRRITGLGVHRGVLASFDRRPVPAAAEVLAAARRVIVLERVSNPTNLGVIIRSAAGLGIDAVLLDPTCTDPLYRRVARVAMGEGYAFPWAWLPRLPGDSGSVRDAGLPPARPHPRPARDPDRRRGARARRPGRPAVRRRGPRAVGRHAGGRRRPGRHPHAGRGRLPQRRRRRRHRLLGARPPLTPEAGGLEGGDPAFCGMPRSVDPWHLTLQWSHRGSVPGAPP